MSRSTDPDHFFQTSHSLAETTRKKLKSKNTNGSPIRLQSKILAVIDDPEDPRAIYIAESAGTARRILLDDPPRTTHTYHGPTTPLPTLALSPTTPHLFAGSWDKSIYSWHHPTTTPHRRYHGHTDFVTALHTLQTYTTPLLISGSADTTIIIWSIATGEKLHTLHGHTRGICSLAIDTPSFDDDDTEAAPFVIFSASSDRSIRRWALHPNLRDVEEKDPPIIQHETSVYELKFSDSDEELWTASADGTSKCLSRSRKWEADTTLPHGDYVRAVALDERGGWVVTAGRDENVKVWDRASGKLKHVFEGHFEEVTGLVVLEGQVVVSVSIDATVRRWSLKSKELERAVREAGERREGVEEEEEERGGGKVQGGGMTEEEQRELEDLMDDD